MDYLEFIARVTSQIPDKGKVMVRYHGLYANAHRGRMRTASLNPLILQMVEDDLKRIPSKGWAEMIRKVYEVEPMVCPKCGVTMKIIAFITEYAVVELISSNFLYFCLWSFLRPGLNARFCFAVTKAH
jgi:hypothetical protein